VSGISTATVLAAGFKHSCTLLSGGAVRCWGDNDSGQLGNGASATSPIPDAVDGTPGVVWSSSNTAVATIDAHGLVTGHGPGTTIITATATDGSVSGSMALYVLTYTIGGTVHGLTGTVVLKNNGSDSLSLATSSGFTFATGLASGAAYNVSVATQPAGQTCAVTNGSGTVGSANVTSVIVTCTANNPSTHTIGGTVSGLTGTVVLKDNGSDSLSLVTDGSFTFATPIASGAAYTVSVATQPTGQTCAVTNGSGTVGSADVTNVTLTCSANSGNNSGGSGGGGSTDPIMLGLLGLTLAFRRARLRLRR